MNEQLSQLNSQLSETNAQLNESNRVKDEYVGRFIHLCSFYIDRLDEMRKQVNKMVKSKDLNALHRFTSDSELRDKNLADHAGSGNWESGKLLNHTSDADLQNWIDSVM